MKVTFGCLCVAVVSGVLTTMLKPSREEILAHLEEIGPDNVEIVDDEHD